ncbi:MAG: hypothetical protein J6O51_08100 [Bacteroidales bacterium]|nr:hypothetical protein [Bacteroidales bacterium]
MAKILKWLLPLVAVLITAASCGPKAKAPKVLVLYYSQSANTKAVAEEFASRLGADIEEILPVEPYSGTYQDVVERSRRERELEILPKVQPISSDIAAYDIIFLGYPVWFGTYALPVASLLSDIDLSGKKVVPFCTFGSGGLSTSSKDLAAKFPDAEILPGYGVRAARIAAAPKEIDRFLKAGGFIEGEYTPLDDFPAPHAVSQDEAAIFDAAVGNYPMIHAKATDASARTIPGGTEYLFTAVDLPRESLPQQPGRQFKVYVNALDGQAPEFTQVVR